MGVDAGGSDEMVANAGAGNVVDELGVVDVVRASVVDVGGGTSLEEVMKGRCQPPLLFIFPTAVHKPLGEHETLLSSPTRRTLWPPTSTVAGRAVPHVPLVDAAEKPSMPPEAFVKYPTVAQLPADAHDRLYGSADGLLDWTPFGNVMLDAGPQVPPVDVMAKETAPPPVGEKYPTAVQFPTEEHATSVIS
ncbi:MAG: hypothetical protein ACO292_00655, partial [Ilumatobacteraceae bacterium]